MMYNPVFNGFNIKNNVLRSYIMLNKNEFTYYVNSTPVPTVSPLSPCMLEDMGMFAKLLQPRPANVNYIKQRLAGRSQSPVLDFYWSAILTCSSRLPSTSQPRPCVDFGTAAKDANLLATTLLLPLSLANKS